MGHAREHPTNTEDTDTDDVEAMYITSDGHSHLRLCVRIIFSSLIVNEHEHTLCDLPHEWYSDSEVYRP